MTMNNQLAVREASIALERIADFVENAGLAAQTREHFIKVKAALDQMGWQTIDTAPKDGSHIMVFNQYCILIAAYDEPNYEDDPCWIDLGSSYPIEPIPTHWMPLPQPPADGGAM